MGACHRGLPLYNLSCCVCCIVDKLLREAKQQDLGASRSTCLTDPPDTAVLVQRFTNGPDWYTLGVKLNLNLAELEGIKETTSKSARLNAVFNMWLEKGADPTWGELIRCLRALNVHGLANELERDYKCKLCCVYFTY